MTREVPKPRFFKYFLGVLGTFLGPNFGRVVRVANEIGRVIRWGVNEIGPSIVLDSLGVK